MYTSLALNKIREGKKEKHMFKCYTNTGTAEVGIALAQPLQISNSRIPYETQWVMVLYNVEIEYHSTL